MSYNLKTECGQEINSLGDLLDFFCGAGFSREFVLDDVEAEYNKHIAYGHGCYTAYENTLKWAGISFTTC